MPSRAEVILKLYWFFSCYSEFHTCRQLANPVINNVDFTCFVVIDLLGDLCKQHKQNNLF